jgi:hypothetical protein
VRSLTLIDTYGLQKKRHSHPQTVHNELIKDKRFVLVGRGIYALSDWGYKRGTVKEVITEILKLQPRSLSPVRPCLSPGARNSPGQKVDSHHQL